MSNTEFLVSDFIKFGLDSHCLTWEFDSQPKPTIPTQVQLTLRFLGNEVDQIYTKWFATTVSEANIHPDDLEQFFFSTSHLLFRDKINWGRVVVLFCFSRHLAFFCLQKSKPHKVRDIVRWTAAFVDTFLATWISQQGGWLGLVHMRQENEFERTKSGNLQFMKSAGLLTLAGLFTIGAVAFVWKKLF